jgi:co-chaperonin GroES (HSP10)
MLKAVNNKVVLEIIKNLDRYAEDVKKRSGLLVSPKVVQGEPNMGKVYSIGPDVTDPGYEVGDMVVFNKAGMFMGFKHEDKDFIALDAFEIQAKVIES